MQLESFLEHSARRTPDKVALVCGDRRWSYAEIESAANRLAHALIADGLQRGDRVAVYLGNSAETVIAIFAVLKAGGVFMPINPTTKIDKLAYILNNSRARTVFLPVSKVPSLTSVWDRLPHLIDAVAVGEELPESFADGNSVSLWRTLLDRHACDTTPPTKRCISVDLAALIYTSGSTGNPKGVMLTHLNMVSASTSITTYLENREDDIILNVLPVSFDYGLYQVLMAFQFGGTVILEQSFTFAHAVLQKLVAERATGFPLVPTMSAILLEMDLSKYDLSHLRYVTNTAAALPTEHILRLRKLLPHVRLYSMYGLTECKRVSYLPVDQIDIRPNSVGIAMPNTEVYIVDDQGNRVPRGETGELVVRGANVMKGYWEAPERTAERLKPGEIPNEMVLHTGDLFRMDDEGYLYFVGRKDDIIKSRGEKVSPKEVENVLYSLPGVSEAAVVGLPDPILGQSICANVTLKPGAELSEREVLAYCRRNLEDFMVPQSIRIRDTLPKSPNGKIDKKQLVGAEA